MTTREEKRWLVNLAILLIIITTIPYLIGYLSETPDWKFTGFLFGVEDGNSYIAKMLGGAEGEWLFRTPYTTVEQTGMIAFLPYILLGKLASQPGLHDQLTAIFQLYRWLGVFLFLFASYDFISHFIVKIWLRRAAVVVICCGGGLGWLFFIGLRSLWGDSLPLEFYSPETFGFLELFGLPHLAVARALLLWGMVTLQGNLQKAWTRREILLSAAIWLGMGFFQPMHIAIGWVLVAGYLLWRFIEARFCKKEANPGNLSEVRELFRRSIMIVVSSVIWIIYNAYMFMNDPYANTWLKQNILLSPSLPSYLLAYGWLLPAAMIGAYFILRKKETPGSLLVLWLILLPVLAYAPTNIQRRLVEGGWTAVVILAVMGFDRLLPERRKLLAFYLAPAFISTLFFLSGMVFTTSEAKKPAFIPQSDVECYRELGNLIKSDQIVLANLDTSNSLPAWVNIRTVVGHGPESAGKESLEPLVSQFFSSNLAEADFHTLVEQNDIQYVLFARDDQDKNLVNPPIQSHLKSIYEGQSCQIFAVASHEK
ncbi:MAG: hypothetical protein AB9891_19035 [Anaerolineaceae bacterium]